MRKAVGCVIHFPSPFLSQAEVHRQGASQMAHQASNDSIFQLTNPTNRGQKDETGF